MRRRLARLTSALVLAVAMLAPAVAVAAPTVTPGVVVLASAGPQSTEGLDPRTADDPDNEFAPPNYEQNFLWGAAVGLLALTLGIIGTIGGLYWWLVVRPDQPQRA